MIIDSPIVVYNHNEDKKKEPTRKKMDDLSARWAAKNKKSLVGQKISLGDYLNNN